MAATSVRTDDARRVLIVEDDRDICELIQDVLHPVGLDTVCVASDREAYEMVRSQPAFAALLIDVNLGHGTTGFDVARYARQVIPDVAVIYVSGQASPQSFKAFGVSDSAFVAKPFTGAQLLDAVRAHIPAGGQG